ncbi:MAG: UvrD-helicase domain-containing protein [Candidatus Nomurabacteria bacterium]|jgi:DNA helicase-2/ATP-dependent DNA helicase PcrA|nr:UvrD-helicase domain-containing protein [Candidatus Nomurabacteria bacterium]
MDKILEGLNPEQRRAVETLSGPMLILAGAGSGKTKTLTHRVANLIAHRVEPWRILAVTFTNKAAREMKDRTLRLLETLQTGKVQLPYMGTFHGIALHILRMDGEAVGLNKNFIIYDADDRRLLLKNIIKTNGFELSKSQYRDVGDDISGAKNQNISADEYLAQATTAYEQKVAQIYRIYEQERRQNGALDFDDLLLYWLRLLDVEEVREKYRRLFKHILIDEYQDTNKIQYQIVRKLVNDERNICVVGDDWQSIYAWRGADYQNILNFEHDFKGATVIKLEQNYRSTKPILDAANKVIKENINRTDKTIWTESLNATPVEVVRVYNQFEEAEFVAQTIAREVAKGASYGEFAILYRMNMQSLPFEKLFTQKQIPYKLVGGQRFYDRAEVKDVIAYLNLLVAPQDKVSFMRAVNVPTRGVGERSLEKYFAGEQLSGKAGQGMHEFLELLADLRTKIATSSPKEIAGELVERLHYLDYLKTGKDERADARVANVKAFVEEAGEYDNLEDFLGSLALFASSDESVGMSAVTLMTMHAAKGLEWDEVFVVGLNEGTFPSKRVVMSGNESDLEEERRLLYVAMTRARHKLYITSHEKTKGFDGSVQRTEESRFLRPLRQDDDLDDLGTQDFEQTWTPQPVKCSEIDDSMSSDEVQICYDDDYSASSDDEIFADWA